MCMYVCLHVCNSWNECADADVRCSVAADGAGTLWPDYELEQLCAKLTLMELQSLCKGLYADAASRDDMTLVLQVN